MDAPHKGKLYYPPMQLLQDVLKKMAHTSLGVKCRLEFEFILAQIATTCTEISERTGLSAPCRRSRTHEQVLTTGIEKDIYLALDPTRLTRAQKKAALRALNMFYEKRNGTLSKDARAPMDGPSGISTTSPKRLLQPYQQTLACY
jgi:hypothetical protein